MFLLCEFLSQLILNCFFGTISFLVKFLAQQYAVEQLIIYVLLHALNKLLIVALDQVVAKNLFNQFWVCSVFESNIVIL